MQSFINSVFSADAALDWTHVLAKQFCAFALGVVVAGVYRFTKRSKTKEALSMMATLVLLTLLISMISSVIGDNVARAFSLVGALSIVRFRTVVEDTRDTAFVILAVGVGMALGAGYLMVPLILIPMAALAALLFGPRPKSDQEGAPYNVSLRTGIGFTEASFRPLLEGFSDSVRLVSASTVRQGTGTDFTFRLPNLSPAKIGALIEASRSFEGVAGIDIQEAKSS